MSGNVRPRVPFSSVTVDRNRASSWMFLVFVLGLGIGKEEVEEACWGRCRRRKLWCWMRYSAVVCLPAQVVPMMPMSMVGADFSNG